MSKLDLSRYNVNILDNYFEDKLKDIINYLELNRDELIQKYKILNNDLFAKTSRAFEVIKGKINEQ